jgi:hypothetical protein
MIGLRVTNDNGLGEEQVSARSLLRFGRQGHDAKPKPFDGTDGVEVVIQVCGLDEIGSDLRVGYGH